MRIIKFAIHLPEKNMNSSVQLLEFKLTKFCDLSDIEKVALLKQADRMMKENQSILYMNNKYHLIDDLLVDLEADCMEAARKLS